MAQPLVLVVDDEPDLVELVCLTLSRMKLDTRVASTLTEARDRLRNEHFDLCLTDMRLPDGDGLDLVESIQSQYPNLPCAVITAHGNVETAVRALKAGAFDFVSKPLDLERLRKLVASAIKLGARGEGAVEATLRGPRLIGRSAVMEKLREMIARVARSQAPVYISGESGSGKELVAHMIHDSSARAEGPFIPVNCGAIPSELMESELFGHKRGSFTGAVADKLGLIQAAEGGTLFLDEVADLPLHMQVKLLRVIQEKSMRPVGEAREQQIDVRILSATHKDLGALVTQGRFREDLYYRINVIQLRVPPLRERGEDIDDLIESILHRTARRAKVATPDVSPAALAALRSYAFPGNVRELENILERAVTLCSGGVVQGADVELRAAALTSSENGAIGSVAMANTTRHATTALESQLEDVERAAIMKALEQTRFNKTAAAKVLGMTFRALRYRIEKLGIE